MVIASSGLKGLLQVFKSLKFWKHYCDVNKLKSFSSTARIRKGNIVVPFKMSTWEFSNYVGVSSNITLLLLLLFAIVWHILHVPIACLVCVSPIFFFKTVGERVSGRCHCCYNNLLLRSWPLRQIKLVHLKVLHSPPFFRLYYIPHFYWGPSLSSSYFILWPLSSSWWRPTLLLRLCQKWWRADQSLIFLYKFFFMPLIIFVSTNLAIEQKNASTCLQILTWKKQKMQKIFFFFCDIDPFKLLKLIAQL